MLLLLYSDYFFFFLFDLVIFIFFFFFQAEDGIRDRNVTGVQTCALPICGRKSMSPSPSRRSAPIASRMVRESVREVTWKEMRAGKLALMRPVMTSTEGRWVARIRWMPARSEERRVGKECGCRWATYG